MNRHTASSPMAFGLQRWVRLSVALALILGIMAGFARPASAANPIVDISATVKKTISIELVGADQGKSSLSLNFGQVSADGTILGASAGVQGFTQNNTGFYFTPQIKVKVTSNSHWQAYMSASNLQGIDNNNLKLAWTTQAPSAQAGASAAQLSGQTQLANGQPTPQQGQEIPHYLVLQVAWGAPAGQQVSGTVTYTASAS